MEKYYVYKTTNKLNGRYYIGVHKSENIELDSYLGSGCILAKAITKYGKENFEREILFEFDTSAEAFNMEKKIVNEDFVNSDDTYNIAIGGHGGKTTEIGTKCPWNQITNRNPEKIRKTAEKHRGMKRSEEAKKNMSKAQTGKNVGEDNYGFKGYWVTPYGKFNSLKLASDKCGTSIGSVYRRCFVNNENKITLYSISKNPTINKSDLGKTWEELGWSFEPVIGEI